MNKNLELFTTECDNCQTHFTTDSPLIFICPECRRNLRRCPKCGSDDITFDWQINPDRIGYNHEVGKVYYWSICCNQCEHEIQLPFDLDEQSKTAAQIFKRWNEQ